MNKKYIVIIVLIFVVVGVYSLVNSSKTPSQEKGTQNASNTVARNDVSSEELLNAEWNMDYKATMLFDDGNWQRFENYEIKLDKKTSPFDTITIRNNDTQQEISSFSAGEVFSQQSTTYTPSFDILVNSKLGKLYAFYIYNSPPGTGFRKAYETDFFGRSVRELKLEQGDYKHPVDYRFSPDYTTLSYIADETNEALNGATNTWEQVGNDIRYFHIIDLLNPNNSVSILLPHGDAHLGFTDYRYWPAAWRFADENTVEFTLYRAKGNEPDGYTQVADKELWSYDRTTGKLTLLETIPLKK